MTKKEIKVQPFSRAYRYKLLMGLVLVILSFVCVMAALYFLIDAQVSKEEELEKLREQITVLAEAKGLAEQKAGRLEDKVGRSLYFDKLIDKANEIYGDQERGRKQGYLWIDRNEKNYVVTLGALNGLKKRDLLIVYDGGQRVGFVEADSVYDVISYVQPVDKSLQDFADDYYRVVIAEASPR